MLRDNMRTWTEDEIDEWYASRPIENIHPPRGRAARLKRKRELEDREDTLSDAERNELAQLREATAKRKPAQGRFVTDRP